MPTYRIKGKTIRTDKPLSDEEIDEIASGIQEPSYNLPSMGDIGTSLVKGALNIGPSIVGLGDIATGGYLGAGLEKIGYDPGAMNEYISSFYSPEQQAASQRFSQAKGFGESARALMHDPGLIGTTVAESLPGLYGGAGIARGLLRAAPRIGTLAAGSIGEGLLGAGQQAADIRQETGDLTFGQGLGALTSGGLTAGITLGGGRLASRFGLPDIDTLLADPTLSGTRRARALLLGGATEGLLEEAPQSGQEQISFNLATGRPMFEGVPSAMTLGAASGGVMGSTIPAIRGGPPNIPPTPPAPVQEYQQPQLPLQPRTDWTLPAQNTIPPDGGGGGPMVPGQYPLPLQQPGMQVRHEPVTDPRMTSIPPPMPGMPPTFTPPPSGMPGPMSQGFQQPMYDPFAQSQADQINAIIEANRQAGRAEIDQQMAGGQPLPVNQPPVQQPVITQPETPFTGPVTRTDQVNQALQDTLRRIEEAKQKSQQPSLPIPPEEGPLFARSERGGLKIGQDIRRSAQELTTGYSSPLSGIMMREGMQNALDAVKKMGKAGKISVRIQPEGFEITDNGPGIGRKGLETVFSDLHSSGKTTEAGATGGKGVGKASYMLGGRNFKVVSVTTEKGKRVRYTVEGTPEQFMEHVDVHSEEVSSDTPTGITIRTEFLDPQNDSYRARSMFDRIVEHTRGLDTQIELDRYTEFDRPTDPTNLTKHPLKDVTKDKLVVQTQFPETGVEVYIPQGATLGKRRYVYVNVLNNGMFQYREYSSIADEDVPNMPDEIIVNLTPRVEEGTKEYPFPVQRESVKSEIWGKIHDVISANLAMPELRGRKAKLKEIYENLSIINLNGIRRNVLFDPGNRLTPDEKIRLLKDPTIQQLTTLVDLFLEDIVSKLDPAISKKLEAIGIVLDPNMHGVHIPNPTSPADDPKSMILINPFELNTRALGNPAKAALDMAVTILHEAAHIGKESPLALPEIKPEDITDDRAAMFLETFIREVQGQGGLDFGHGLEFVKRLGEVYVKTGIQTSLQFVDAYEQAIGATDYSGFNAEFQKLLSIYLESRGRDAVTEDFLSGTGIKQGSTSGRGSSTTGNGQGNAGGTPPSNVIPPPPPPNQPNNGAVGGNAESFWQAFKKADWKERWNLSRGMVSVDLPFLTSAGLRQGLPWITSKHWWQAWVKQAKAFGDEEAFKTQQNMIERDPLFRPQFRFRGQGLIPIPEPSIAKQAGLFLSDMTEMKIENREEQLRGRLAEKLPGVWGKWIKASNRSYTAFLNHIRTSAFKELMTDLGAWDGRKVTNPELAKEIANFINTTTGRGGDIASLGISKDRSVSVNLGQVMGPASEVLFSPRLWKSRLDMLNPSTYMMASPKMRQQWLKSYLGVGMGWWGITSLLEMIGADVEKDPNSSDYGKAKFGNTRIDPGGGFQQNLVLMNRILNPLALNEATRFAPYNAFAQTVNQFAQSIPEIGFTPVDLATAPMRYGGGGITSPISGNFNPYGAEIRGYTRKDDIVRFIGNKLHPSAKFIWDYFARSEREPFYAGDRIMQMFVPMFAGDLAETFADDPGMLPYSMVAGSIGMGSQTFEGGPGKPVYTPLLGLEEYDFPMTQ